MSPKRVTDHAVVRFMERGGFSEIIAEVRARIARGMPGADGERVPDGVYSIYASGLFGVVRDGVVTTIVEMRKKKRKRAPRTTHTEEDE